MTPPICLSITEIIMGNSNRTALRGAAILVVMLVLPGCIPWSVSMAMSGISYMATGKSISDHVLSGLVQKDCNVGRAVLDQSEICQDNQTLAMTAEGIGHDWRKRISPAPADGADGI
jgi:hypothetical protein